MVVTQEMFVNYMEKGFENSPLNYKDTKLESQGSEAVRVGLGFEGQV